MSSFLVAVALLVLNAFFVAIEFALVKVRATQLAALATEGRPGAALGAAMRGDLNLWLSVCQVGVTLASLGLGWVAEPAFAALLEPVLAPWTPVPPVPGHWTHILTLVITFGFVTFLHIVLGEQVPKTLAIAKPEFTVLALAWPLRLFYFGFYPAIWVLNAGTRAVLSLLGPAPASHDDAEALSEDELKLVFASSVAAGELDVGRAELLNRVLGFMEKTARQILVPRSQMTYLDLELSLDENVTRARSSGHTWMPVVRGSVDRVEGLVNVKDLFFLLHKGELKAIAQVQRPVLFVPENATLEQLLGEFKRRNKQMAVVVDEHGGTSGLLTLADVVAELVGNVAQVGRKVEPVKTLPGGRLDLPGTAQLDDLELTLELTFDVDHAEVSTIAGYMMTKLGRVPRRGDVWTYEGYRLEVSEVNGPRVMRVRIEPYEAAAIAPSPSGPRIATPEEGARR